MPAARFTCPLRARPGGPQSKSEPKEIPLAGAIPGDVFLYTWGRHNPERAFLEAHWSKVWDAFLASGVIDELLGLALSEADEEQKALFEELHQRFGERIAAIDWRALTSGEVAFAERLPRLNLRPGGQPVFAMEMVFLARPGADADVDALHAGLVTLIETALEELKARAGVELPVERSKTGAVELTTIDLTGGKLEGQRLPLTLGRAGRTLFASFGESIGGEVSVLLGGAGGAQPILASARLRQAMAQLPAAEDSLAYFDMPNLHASVKQLADQAFQLAAAQMEVGAAGAEVEGEPEGPSELDVAKKVVGRLLDCMDVLSCSASVQTTEGHSTHAYSIALLSAEAAANPLYPVLASSKPVEDFARFLPRETESFAVDAGISLPALYTFFQDTFASAGEPGLAVWKIWETKQAEVGFDVRADLLDWLDTASVQANFEVDGQESWIFMLRVLDDEAARKGLAWGLEVLTETFSEKAAEIPPLAMFQPRLMPSTHSALEGFQSVAFGMIPPMVMGVRDGWMMLGSSDKALVLALETAAGRHENVRKNEALMKKALAPNGPAQTVAFTDHRGTAQEIAAALNMVAGMGGMMAAQIPDEEGQRAFALILSMVGKLAPVIASIDFFDSTATLTEFDGKGWQVHAVTHYVAPEPAEAPAAK